MRAVYETGPILYVLSRKVTSSKENFKTMSCGALVDYQSRDRQDRDIPSL